MSETPGNQKNDNQKKDSIVRDIRILVVITLAAGVLLGAAYSITKGPIARAKVRAREEARKTVLQDADSFTILAGEENADARDQGDENGLLDTIHAALEDKGLANTRVEQIGRALNDEGEDIGYVVTCTNSEGYGGDVGLMCGISSDEDNTLTIEGISFLTLTETAGMGMRAKESSFTEQFAGRQIEEGQSLVYTKDGASLENEIDAISGCTITTTAVTKSVNAALEAVRIHLASEDDAKDGQTEQEG